MHRRAPWPGRVSQRREGVIRGMVIAGTKSGCGKTTVSLGLMAAFLQRGLKVAPFKVGPDFIDPGHHTRVTGVKSRNLDGWMLSRRYNRDLFNRSAARFHLAVVEGVMGLFDGYDGTSEAGSTAQMAKWLALPVILLVDAASMARSAAAVVLGFERFDPALAYAGVIFNNVAGPRHLQYLRQALEASVSMPCLGGLPRAPEVSIPERHLGLVTREEHPLTDDAIRHLARHVTEHIDLDGLLARLPERAVPVPEKRGGALGVEKPVRLAVAKDEAFCFYYPDNLELLEAAGARLVFFSPIKGKRLPPDVDGLYLGGGYPELFARKLAQNASLRNAVKAKSRQGMPVYAECGGFMFLCERLRDLSGRSFPMCGCFPFESRMTPRLKALGYREVTLKTDTVIGKRGQVLKGHEFHYSELISSPAEVATVYRITDRSGLDKPPEGYCIHRTLGSYTHLHFGSQPEAAAAFVESCRRFQRERIRTS